MQLLAKYRELPNPPKVSARLQRIIGLARPGTNDAVDDLLLAAVDRDAIDYLVTADVGIHAKARRAGLQRRVASPTEALAIVRNLFPPLPGTIPPVRSVKAHALDEADPIFDSFRRHYPDFDDWLRRCKREHRDAWVIGREEESLSAVTILKREAPAEFGLTGAALKICTFKVAEHARGFRYGELLLRIVFEECYRRDVQWAYITTFEDQQDLLRLLAMFGFFALPVRTPAGELVLVKQIHPTSGDREALDPLAFHVRFGPRYVKGDGVPCYLVPIQPRYHAKLFPEMERQDRLFPGESTFGNSMLKAYLSLAAIRELAPGDVLLFYKSVWKQARAVGVVEDTLVSQSPEEVSRFVGRRTVYDFVSICRWCARGKVLAVLFRQAQSLDDWVNHRQLVDFGLMNAAPQSITRVRKRSGLEWLSRQIQR